MERERKAAEAEARRAAELAAKKAADEKRRADEAAKTEANERATAKKLAAEKESREAAARAKAAEDRAAAARDAEARLAKSNNDAKKAAEDKVMKDYGATTTSGSNFADNRGNMPFPVRGQITHRFGRQPHPVFKNIQEENSGIKISVPAGSVAKSVFPGVVTKILYVGGSKTVMVRHGSYFTIYSNLSSVSVSQNQQVSTGTPIGQVGLDLDGTYTLEFQIWNGNSPVDPLGWISN